MRVSSGGAVPEHLDATGLVKLDLVRAGVGTLVTAHRDVQGEGAVPLIGHAQKLRFGSIGPQSLLELEDCLPPP
jgi:hypothetical protein